MRWDDARDSRRLALAFCPYIGHWRPIAAGLPIGTRCGHLGQLAPVARYVAQRRLGTLGKRAAPTGTAASTNAH